MGLAHLQLSLTASAAQPILHLAALNTHITASIPHPAAFFVPRQQAPFAAVEISTVTTSLTRRAWGVSAFAFQVLCASALASAWQCLPAWPSQPYLWLRIR